MNGSYSISTPTSATQKCRVMLVDDSALIRNYLAHILSGQPDIEIIAQAENGQIAVETATTHCPDVIILDIEMPEMDGITALPKLLDVCPKVRVIMLSTLTTRNAAISIRALSMGASDYLEKPTASTDKEQFKLLLLEKIRSLFASRSPSAPFIPTPTITPPSVPIAPLPSSSAKKVDALAVGCSTGGPQALMEFFKAVHPSALGIPVFITQHMPPTFTTFLAENLHKTTGITCLEAQDGMEVVPGTAYLAPGDFHMLIERKGLKTLIKLDQGPQENFCRPAVDPMLRSLANIYGKNLLVVIMTGMGQDGMEGCKVVAQKQGHILIQDATSSVVWGMPGAVSKANLQNGTFSLHALGPQVANLCKGGLPCL